MQKKVVWITKRTGKGDKHLCFLIVRIIFQGKIFCQLFSINTANHLICSVNYLRGIFIIVSESVFFTSFRYF